MPKVMIMSIGGSPEPLKKSISEHCPEEVIFFASHDSVKMIGEAVSECEKKPKTVCQITEDEHSLYESYKAARKCLDRVKKMKIDPAEIMVDYTGGTKVMTASLVLATVGEPFKFNYVGGMQRTKEGMGVVVDGSEKMFQEMSPWSVFAEEERRQIVILFNLRRYSAVIEIIDSLSQRKLPNEISFYFSFVRLLSEGYLLWEQFNHKEAVVRIGKGIEKLKQYVEFFKTENLLDFENSVESSKKSLEKIIEATKGLSVMHPLLLDDLINNSRRRMADAQYDDAAARIYRALEMHGQIVFKSVTGFDTGKVPLSAVPENIKEEFIAKHYNRAIDALKLPLQATFTFLKESGNQWGDKFFERKKEIENIQSNRNKSILAHDINPVGRHAAESIFKTITDFIGFKNELDFPELPI
jgi:CRISPR-associated protein (TIGR02710 family)